MTLRRPSPRAEPELHLEAAVYAVGHEGARRAHVAAAPGVAEHVVHAPHARLDRAEGERRIAPLDGVEARDATGSSWGAVGASLSIGGNARGHVLIVVRARSRHAPHHREGKGEGDATVNSASDDAENVRRSPGVRGHLNFGDLVRRGGIDCPVEKLSLTSARRASARRASARGARAPADAGAPTRRASSRHRRRCASPHRRR